MAELTLPSGAKLNVTVSPFRIAKTLHDEILKALKGVDVGDDLLDMEVTSLKDALISVVSSPDVERALSRCFERVTYEGVKLSDDLLDDPKFTDGLRKDWHSICFEVAKANVWPFFEQTFSRLRGRTKIQPSAPK